jgi:hypothetical protein
MALQSQQRQTERQIMNEITVFLSMLMAPAFFFLLWLEVVELSDFFNQSKAKVCVLPHCKSK